jgi:GT2 family glycosyltransferase
MTSLAKQGSVPRNVPTASLLADISVIVVLHNSLELLADCLCTLPDETEVVLVDNGSLDTGLEHAVRLRPDATAVRSLRNRGFGAGCNLGWKAATRSVVAFINPDVRLQQGVLERLSGRLAEGPFRIVGPAVIGDDGRTWECKAAASAIGDAAALLPASQRWGPRGIFGKIPRENRVHRVGGPVPQVEGVCFVMKKSDLEEIGGFDEDFFLYDEEESLAIRLRSRGGAAWYVPEAHVLHSGARSTQRLGALAIFHRYRSRILLYRKRDGDRLGRLKAGLLLLASIPALPVAIANRILNRNRFLTPAGWLAVVLGILAGARAGESGISYQ